jgi:hypothetical protein
VVGGGVGEGVDWDGGEGEVGVIVGGVDHGGEDGVVVGGECDDGEDDGVEGGVT